MVRNGPPRKNPLERGESGSSVPGLGAHVVAGGVSFRVWAPHARQVAVSLLAGSERRTVQLHPEGSGYFSGIADQAQEGDRYMYLLDGSLERPDPASRLQPQGVHGPSQVFDSSSYRWQVDFWHNPPFRDYIIYELHVGTFSREGTFAGIIPLLDHLVDLGITAVELMPVTQFPGRRNWGYDGVNPFAPHISYGGPTGLMELVDACHGKGLAVMLDVVYNHLGPEGNYLRDFGDYFTDRYRTPWGDAMNFDGPESDHVREYFIANATHWIRDYRIDALRLDAVHGIFDMGACHFLEELNAAVHVEAERLGRQAYVIAESDLNDSRIISPRDCGGYGIDAQWCDDFHHALHALLTGERDGYYMDFGYPEQMVTALTDRYVYSGQYSPYRRKRHGNSTAERTDEQFVVFSQNHDQVGNRMLGERLSTLISFESLKVAAGLILLSPYVPLLFMGEEYGEDNPFLYFVDHEDADLIAAVRAGRKEEFKSFSFRGDPPDPESEATFGASKLSWEKRDAGRHQALYRFYKRLIRLRKEIPALTPGEGGRREVEFIPGSSFLRMRRYGGQTGDAICLFGLEERDVTLSLPMGTWRKLVDSSEKVWGGAGSDLPESVRGEAVLTLSGPSCVVYERVG